MENNLLIIDDDENVRVLLNLEFSDLGFHVTLAENAVAGLKILKDEAVDLVILDIKMPGMDGIEALGKIISVKRDLPVIIHSAYSHYKENYLTWSATAYVVKSPNLAQLKQTVVDVLAGNFPSNKS